MITSQAVRDTAGETGFRPDVVEKVLRLRGILERLDGHPNTRGMWVLKGGTALNLFYLDVPRLSIDIDLNFIGAEGVEEMRRVRPDFERGLTACCEREGCSVRRGFMTSCAWSGRLYWRGPKASAGSSIACWTRAQLSLSICIPMVSSRCECECSRCSSGRRKASGGTALGLDVSYRSSAEAQARLMSLKRRGPFRGISRAAALAARSRAPCQRDSLKVLGNLVPDPLRQHAYQFTIGPRRHEAIGGF